LLGLHGHGSLDLEALDLLQQRRRLHVALGCPLPELCLDGGQLGGGLGIPQRGLLH
jgi:hypothetical protein